MRCLGPPFPEFLPLGPLVEGKTQDLGNRATRGLRGGLSGSEQCCLPFIRVRENICTTRCAVSVCTHIRGAYVCVSVCTHVYNTVRTSM